MSVVARVVTDVTGIDKSFDYLVPEQLAEKLTVGCRVRVDLNSRRVGGWVVALHSDTEAEVPRKNLSPIVAFSGNGVEPDLVSLCEWTARKWCGPMRAVLASASAPRVSDRRGQPLRGRNISVPDDAVVETTRKTVASGGGLVIVPPLQSAISVVAALAKSGPVLVVCPTKRMAFLGAARLRQRGCVVAAMPDDWSRAASGVDVVIGTRSAVWAPCPGLTAIVVIDSHDDALREERSPTWNAVDVARERAHQAGIAFIETTPTPTPASLHAYPSPQVVTPRQVDSHEQFAWPRIVVEDLLEVPVRGSLVTPSLVAALRNAAETVLSVVNVKGRARIVACTNCGDITRCPTCSTTMSLQSDGAFNCSVCGATSPTVCHSCGRTDFKLLRRGVSQLRDEMAAAANRNIVEVGRDTNIDTLDVANCYIGTEAALHRVSRADTVCLLDVDDDLMSSRLSSFSDTLALIVRASRIVGRNGTLIVQTREPRHPLMTALAPAEGRSVQEAVLDVVRDVVERRRALHLPPFRVYAVIDGLPEPPAAELGVAVAPARDGRIAVLADSHEALGVYVERLRSTHQRIRVYVDPSRV